MLLTLWCIAIVLFTPLAVGIPARWLLGRRRPLDESAWVEASFVGIGVLVLVLQNLVYCHVPLRWSVPPFCLLVAGGWIGLCWKKKLRESLADCPWDVFAACAVVYLLHASGLLAVGVKHYVGRAWTDQFNYTVMAQSLTEIDVDTPRVAVNNQPYLIKAIEFHHERIGQAILQGFHVLVTGCDARLLFEPTILLAPALLVLAIYALARRFCLARTTALACAVLAGVMPGITLLHLESFLSHTLGLPLLLMSLVFLDEYEGSRGRLALIRAALLLALTVSVYTEFLVILLVIVSGFLCLALLRRPSEWRLAGAYFFLALSPFLLNPIFCLYMKTLLMKLNWAVLAGVYPWALQTEGVSRLWVGDLIGRIPQRLQPGLRPICLLLTALGFGGLGSWCLDRLRPAAGCPGVSRGFCLGILVVLAVPLAVLVKDDRHPYQFYKLLLTVSPLLILGLFLLRKMLLNLLQVRALAQLAPKRARLLRGFAFAPLGLVGLLCGTGTLAMAIGSASGKGLTRFVGARLLLAADFQQLEAYLGKCRGLNIVYHHNDSVTCTGYYLNSWIAYVARHNKLWLANPYLNDNINVADYPELAPTLDLNELPGDVLFLSRKGTVFLQPPSGFDQQERRWENTSYVLWSPRQDNWAMISNIENPYDLEPRDGSFFWMGTDETRVNVLAGHAGRLLLQAKFRRGPSIAEHEDCRLQIRTDAGFEQVIVIDRHTEQISLPVRVGVTQVHLRVVDPPTLAPPRGGDPRNLLLGVADIKVTLEPESAGSGGH